MFLVAGLVIASAVAVTAYAAARMIIPMDPSAPFDPPRAMVIQAEPQTSNRAAKADRVALLLDSPSYTNFSPALLEVTFSRLQKRENPNGLLNDAQIAGIQHRLRLTPRQVEYWPAVAGALRDVGWRYFSARQHRKPVRALDLNSVEVQRLIEVAAPLIGQLSETQKREVRQLVRVIGLEIVASRI